jgi:hypothetical protein
MGGDLEVSRAYRSTDAKKSLILHFVILWGLRMNGLNNNTEFPRQSLQDLSIFVILIEQASPIAEYRP